ncbi:uncharacterized protein AMSG_10532 [Thecamonas trahens ATCC 50062]|uniref:Uncharacterized protein n=1 Tax=Thecamonas trahens ATCC 50062 TaxID=461836 RepID=A0A0L0DTS5_THETB|nr:hypothetical protein AMSG_10532 [Thecamonas trahens ATCC 50062]KNC54878.1 hypothetical protein AMSG_10532 [Thecamonas trahens ATCC 50062]|eukprot:XP_013753474.1 hypothetical protein AMSG_10532 [Thecamonas trahens ATCC 50062]
MLHSFKSFVEGSLDKLKRTAGTGPSPAQLAAQLEALSAELGFPVAAGAGLVHGKEVADGALAMGTQRVAEQAEALEKQAAVVAKAVAQHYDWWVTFEARMQLLPAVEQSVAEAEASVQRVCAKMGRLEELLEEMDSVVLERETLALRNAALSKASSYSTERRAWVASLNMSMAAEQIAREQAALQHELQMAESEKARLAVLEREKALVVREQLRLERERVREEKRAAKAEKKRLQREAKERQKSERAAAAAIVAAATAAGSPPSGSHVPPPRRSDARASGSPHLPRGKSLTVLADKPFDGVESVDGGGTLADGELNQWLAWALKFHTYSAAHVLHTRREALAAFAAEKAEAVANEDFLMAKQCKSKINELLVRDESVMEAYAAVAAGAQVAADHAASGAGLLSLVQMAEMEAGAVAREDYGVAFALRRILPQAQHLESQLAEALALEDYPAAAATRTEWDAVVAELEAVLGAPQPPQPGEMEVSTETLEWMRETFPVNPDAPLSVAELIQMQATAVARADYAAAGLFKARREALHACLAGKAEAIDTEDFDAAQQFKVRELELVNRVSLVAAAAGSRAATAKSRSGDSDDA